MSSSNSGSGEQVEHLQLEKLKRFQRAFAWKFENHPCVFIENFGFLIEDWEGQLPDLHGIFAKEEIDRILVACVESIFRYRHVVELVARSGYRDQPESDEDGKPLVRRTTAVHAIAKIPWSRSNVEVLKDLFAIYDKFHVNYTDDRSGYTHLYVACKYGLLDVAERFLELGADPDYLVPGTGGETLLHHFAVAEYPEKSLLRMLLSHDADPNLAKYEDGTTALHAVCRKRQVPGRRSTMWTLFECVDELQRQQWTTSLLLDAQDNRGDTPLHLALRQLDYDTQSTVRGLLRRGADPNLANAKGQTALHAVCRCDAENEDSFLKINNSSMKSQDHIRKLLENYSRNVLFVFDIRRKELMQLMLDICDENERTLRIDARDNEGNAALHLAVARGRPQLTELLLRRGADPGLGNEKGTTPLHLVARRDAHDDGFTMLKLFFESTSSEERLWIDARDDEGRTALEWAVARCCPRHVEMLLDRGADMASFVFPTASDCDRYAEDIGSPVMKLVAATGLLAIVELLEKRGYELDRNDALKVMGFFDEYKLFLTSRYGPVVAQRVDLLFKEMAKNSTYSGYYEFARSCEQRLQIMYPEFVEDGCSRLCEKVSRKFFRDWALDSFMELTHHRLPLLCCEMIFEELWNRDLFNICLAAAGRSSQK